jgi:hypothetical protein
MHLTDTCGFPSVLVFGAVQNYAGGLEILSPMSGLEIKPPSFIYSLRIIERPAEETLRRRQEL